MTSTSEHEHTYSTVYGGEQWCDEHDSAYPCPGSATDQCDSDFGGRCERPAGHEGNHERTWRRADQSDGE